MLARFDKLFGALPDDQWFPSPAHVMRRAAILDAFSSFPPGRLMEMGCGAGRMLGDWGRLGHTGFAVDLDPTARTLAVQCTAAFDLNFTVTDQPEWSEFFDYLVAIEVLEHVEQPAELLKEWVHQLKDGGILLATVPAFQNLWGRSDEWAGHIQRFEPDQFRKLVEDAGLQVLDMHLYGYPIGNLLRLAGNVTSGIKMRSNRSEVLNRLDATLASGHDRSIETRLSPLLRSPPGRLMLKWATALQRRHLDRGHGLILVARKSRTWGGDDRPSA
jgi:SAM-dependent methyltransferase